MLDSNGSFDNPFFQDKKIVKIDCKWKGQEYSKDTFGFTHAEYVCSFILKENPEAEIVLVPIVRKNKKSTVLDMIEGIELLIEEQVDIRWTESTYVNRRISLMRGSAMRESVTDVRIILECLQEAYQMEGDMVRSGKNIHATMIYPFVRMLQEKCRDLTEEQIHKTLWKEYEISGADRMFVERASKILEPYEGESEDEK